MAGRKFYGDQRRRDEKRISKRSYLENTQNFIATKECDVLIEFKLNLGKNRLFVPHRLKKMARRKRGNGYPINGGKDNKWADLGSIIFGVIFYDVLLGKILQQINQLDLIFG